MDHKQYKELEQNPNTSEDDIILEPVPEKRKNRSWWASFFICLVIVFVVIAYCFFENTIVEYHVDNDIYTNLTGSESKTATCQRRDGKNTYYILFIVGPALLGMILGMILVTLVDRLCLVAEECRNWSRRYDRKAEAFKACFGGVSDYAIFALLTLMIVGICTLLAFNPTFELKYMLYIFGGIAVGPLLLILNTQSDIAISTIIEEKETTVGTTLAWSYYFTYLEKGLPKFRESLSYSTIVSLSSNKLILVISHDCYAVDNLAELDNNITKVNEITHGEYIFPVYCLIHKGNKYKYVVHYIKEPLETIATMSRKSKAIKGNNEREYQVKMLYKTLSEILDKDNRWSEDCILVPIKVKTLDGLKNGGLVKLIMRKVQAVECQPKRKEHDGFMVMVGKDVAEGDA